jgi:hypothetical protein
MKSAAPLGSLPRPTDNAADVSPPVIHALAGLKTTDRAAREEILHRAYALWESEGRPEGRKLANWLDAEASVLSGR